MKRIKKSFTYLLVLGIIFASVLGVSNPKVKASTIYSKVVLDSLKQYKAENHTHTIYMEQYDRKGDYFNFSDRKGFPSPVFKFDNDGVPMTQYRGNYHYNPVSVAQSALKVYGKYLKTQDDDIKRKFYAHADKLLELQSKDGAFRLDFTHTINHIGVVYKPGWVSALAQGQALSVLSRAYELDWNLKYKRAGKNALNFLMTPKQKGGVMTTLADMSKSWKDNIWFEEYVSTPDNYTLNGYMFTLVGLYDWSHVAGARTDHGQITAEKLFKEGIASLKLMLSKYDLGGFTSYDLTHLVNRQQPHINVFYHKVHIYLLHGLYTVTGDTYLKSYRDRWIGYVEKIE
ncbi:D-glucuronyl C5-epimerase family protein [Lederbergia citri]|uniref:D-glucuronyl C5-epimerase family protein n=1 Tax=Lederbergia citri TaxID=2833580 RepID=A0A942YHT7_9BACI|nr:D-glucuronyl C5-epimerase family protein [Lederbergia citri]MBS4195740.1 D-glucuronyl C5-epimerase family protein [Lederbergia citri]